MLRFFQDPTTANAIDALSSARRLTVIVGAGASVEVGLPSWTDLVSRMLLEVLRSRKWEDDAEALVERALADGPIAAAQVLSAFVDDDDDREQLIRRHLYGDTPPQQLFPGPMVMAIAHLQQVFGRSMRIVTTNYDPMLEEALQLQGERNVRTYVVTRQPTREAVGVTHLHGFIGRDTKGDIVLSEADYQRMQSASSWQERLMVSRLDSGPCLFVGASLTDPNLLRFLHGHGRRHQHFVTFARPEVHGAEAERRRDRWETAECLRWAQVGVTPLFADNYADVSQFIHEVAHRRRSTETGSLYRSLASRLATWFDTELRTGVLRLSPPIYADLQSDLSSELARTLEIVRSTLCSEGIEVEDEVMQLGLFSLWIPKSGHRPREETAVLLASSDRTMRSSDTLAPIPLSRDSAWTGVRVICEGVAASEDIDTYASRWHFMRGVPIFNIAPRQPMGSIVLSSTHHRETSALAQLDARGAAEVDRFLAETGRRILGRVTEPLS